MIDFTRSFELAWERMMVILFQPFSLGKWCAIGFSAFLAGLLEGGNGFNSFNVPNTNNNFGSNSTNNSFGQFGGQIPSIDWHQINSNLNQAFANAQTWFVVLGVLFVVVFILVFAVLLYWLGARGEFMFLDNLVRNRAAIAWPWTHYARQANSLFFFYLLFLLVMLVLILPIIAVAVVMAIPLYQQSRWPHGDEILWFVLLGLLYFGIAIISSVVIFVFREMGVPLMFRNGLMAFAAFKEAMKLIATHPLNIFVFILLRMAIFIGVAILSFIVCCATCCFGALPYIGTVLLLPALVYVRCFTLDCLAQFGPQYDVWTIDVPPVNPQPPPG